MDHRYSSSRYTPARPRSPTFNPARASLPTSIGYSSMYGGDIHVMPTSSTRYASSSSRGHHHHSGTPATTTTTYAVTKDPLSRGTGLRDASRNRSHRSSTLDSTAPRPVIVTTTQARPQASSSSHHSSSNRHSSPTRDDYRSSDSTFYTQPASSIRSRSHHRGGSYSATMDNEEFTRLRERTLDPTLARHDTYRPSRSSAVYANSTRHANAPIDIGGDGYEYTTPSDLARYDLDHTRPPSRSRRRESVDRGYYRPSVNVTTTESASRPYNEASRYEKRGGPPPTTWGLDKINRSTTNVYDPSQSSIPPAAPAAPVHLPVPPSPKDRRSTGVPSSMDVAATSVAAGTVAGATASRRPVSVYQEGPPRSSHHEDFYRSRDDDRAQRQARDVDRKYDPVYGSGDYFHDDGVTSRGFGIRTDSAPVGGDFDDRREPRREARPESRNGYRSESRPGYRPESRGGHRPESRSGHRTSPSDAKRGSDDESKRRDDKDRSKRESVRLEADKDRHTRRTSTATEDEAERKRLRDKLSAGLGLAATAIGLGSAAKEKEKDERPEKLERESRRRSDEEDPGARAAERYKPRDESRDPRDRAPVIVETRRAPAEQDAEVRDRDRERDRDRNRRDAEARLTGDSLPTSQRDGSPDDDEQKSRRPKRQTIGFNPTNTNDIRELKEQLAAMKDENPKEKVPIPVDRLDRPERSERPERYERSERLDRPERLDRDDRSDKQTYADLPIRETKERTPSPKKESPPPKRESPVSIPSADSGVVSTRDDYRGRDTTPPRSDEKQVRVVSPPRDKSDAKPLKGILKAPSKFPEEDNPIREGVAPHKDDKKLKEVPPGARWTKISRKIVNPEALTVGKERFEVRDDFVIVLRVLSKEEIQAYAAATQVLRERRREESGKDRDRGDRERDHDRGRDRDGDDDDRRKHRHHRREEGDDDRYDDDRDRERHRRHRRDDEDYDDDPRRRDDYHHRHHREREREREPLAIEG
ncbi:zinc finger protein DHHC domain containing protein [Colletotrichum tofieldiae]|uniref:Zinc finger protein DHHC domain containing protein n=1 Tax=Colletotrichum tofieldiae TaxID=708197 RepID=A0A166TGB6_9PEZI|nr:zinc finger protein DHHC domain containing protein [Colletotrichum tofieldiae]